MLLGSARRSSLDIDTLTGEVRNSCEAAF